MENKQSNIQDVTDRYIYEVTKRLPLSQRKDIEQELRTLIEDMLADRAETPTQADIDAVLSALGNPSDLAGKYADKKSYLIGPAYYNTYLLILKIVLPSVALGITVAMLVSLFTVAPAGIWEPISNYFATIFSALFQAFAWVTIGFALADRYNMKTTPDTQAKWKPRDLPPIPQKKAIIPKSQPIAGMVFTILVIILFNSVPHLLGIYSVDTTTTIIPFFNLTVLHNMLPLLNVIFCLGLLRELLKLIIGKYNLQLAIPDMILNAAALALTFAVFSNTGIWNADLVNSLSLLGDFTVPSGFDLTYYLNIATRVILGLATFGFVVDSITTLAKAIRYNK